jgi:hypothetical protein
MSKLFVQVEHVEDLIGRADNYLGCDLCNKDSVDATARKPITNADRIRGMTDEELAELIISITEDSTPNWIDWLKQEATE